MSAPIPTSAPPVPSQSTSHGRCQNADNGTLLYHQTIISTQNITHVVQGSFSLPNSQDLIIIRHTTLELWTLRCEMAKLECLHSVPLFAKVYSAVAVPTNAMYGSAARSWTSNSSVASRSKHEQGILSDHPSSILTGQSLTTHSAQRDLVHYLAITSESGYLTLLRYELAEPPILAHLPGTTLEVKTPSNDEDTNVYVTTSLRGKFIKVSEQCLGHSGSRLTVPGAKMVVDSQGEALFITAVMRNKVIVPLKRTNAKLSAAAKLLQNKQERDSYDAERGGGENTGINGVDALSESNKEDKGTLTRSLESEQDKKKVKLRMKTSNGILTFGNPIESHRNTVILSVTALEGSIDENAVFAVLEQEIIEDIEVQNNEKRKPDASISSGGAFLKLPSTATTHDGTEARLGCRKFLVVYAYVPSLRQVQRVHLVNLPATAHRLVGVPCAPRGPGGVLVCTDTDLIWYDLFSSASDNPGLSNSTGNPNLGVGGIFKCIYPLPRRVTFTETLYDTSIIQHVIATVANDYFLLLQDEQGDLFRVLLSATAVKQAYDALRVATAAAASQENNLKPALKLNKVPTVPNPLVVHYFDTIPPANAMVLFRRGYLFSASEAASVHSLYKIIRDGYNKDSEYIVKRVRRVLLQAQPGGDCEGGGASAKPQPDGDYHNHSEEGKRNSKEDLIGMPAPAPLLSKTTVGSKSGERLQQVPASGARVIAVYQPHRQLRHIGLVRSYPNTPAIMSLAACINDKLQDSATTQEDDGGYDTEGGPLRGRGYQQRQVQIVAVGGRGSDSVLFTASYGYTTRREGRFFLPATFQGIIALPSAIILQQLAQTQRASIAELGTLIQNQNYSSSSKHSRKPTASGSSSEIGGHEQRRRAKAVKQLLALMQEQQQVMGGSGTAAVEMDKVVLTTAQGTTVFQVGRSVELDNWTGFATAERTLAAATLPWGQGYVQVTSRGIYVLPMLHTSEPYRTFEVATKNSAGEQSQPILLPNPRIIEPISWTEPHGKPLLVAATTSTTILVSFLKGGIASFRVETDPTAFVLLLKQCDALPTFPTAQAISLLRIPQTSSAGLSQNVLNLLLHSSTSTTLATAASASLTDGVLQSMLAQSARMLNEGPGNNARELAAVATVAQEVYILDPTKLREPLEKINCRRQKGNRNSAGMSNESEQGIVSILLTFLGGGNREQPRIRRLFCLIGHLDGTLTRCELDPITGKLIERVQLSCGNAPCQTIAGDGETFCYIQSGEDCWCCEIWDGVVKTVPWRFPSRQTTFAPFVMPQKQQALNKRSNKRENYHTEEPNDGIVKDEDGNEFIVIDRNDPGGVGSSVGEHVIAVRNRELSLFLAQKTGSGGSRCMEYSMSTHSMPLQARRILQHPTRPSYFIVASTEHRSHGMRAVDRSRREAVATGGISATGTGIPLDAPQRSLGPRDHYNSSLQLFLRDSNHVFPPYYLPEGDGILSVSVGSFQLDFGKEPVVVVGAASQYTHGSGCGRSPSCSQGWLRTFRFTSYATTVAGTGNTRSGTATPQPRAIMMDSEGNPILHLELLHSTLIRTNSFSGSHTERNSNAQTGANSSALGAPDYPSAVHICEDVGLLFVGLGPQNGLRIYVWGQQQFLRKRQLPNFPSRIVAIETMFFTPPSSHSVNNNTSIGTDKSSLGKFYLSDLYHCPFDRPEARRRAMEKQLLVVCATMSHSVIIAALQPGSSADANGSVARTPSFLLVVAQDTIPRSLTALAVLEDEHTIAVADRFGSIIFLRLPDNTRTKFSTSIDHMSDAEISAVNRYISNEQYLEEVACHYTGEVVSSLQVQPHNPSQDADPSVGVYILFYGTALGRVGAYTPFVSEEDAAMAAYVQPVLISHLRALLAPGCGALPYNHRTNIPRVVAMMSTPTHHIIDGDLMVLYRQSCSLISDTTVFTLEARNAIEEEIESSRRMEAARRKVLGLPHRELPSVTDLVAKQRALVTLPE